MGFFQPDKGRWVSERRASRRTRATCAASLQTLTVETFGYLWDLSQTGARVSVESPPPVGESAVLKWATDKVMCRVIWIDRDMCGVAFDRPIDEATVASSARLIGIVEQPVATVGNIPVGRKRSSPKADGDDGTSQDLLATRRPFQSPR
jgi:PilZ domain-containing protein